MNRNNTKILNKLNKLIDEEVENGLKDTSLIKECLGYIVDNNYFLYCLMTNDELNSCMYFPATEDNESLISFYADGIVNFTDTYQNGIEIYHSLAIKSYDVFAKTIGKNGNLPFCIKPTSTCDEVGNRFCYVEIKLKDILENIEFGNYGIDEILINSENSTYFVDIATMDEILDKHEELAAKFAEHTSPRIGVWTGTILDPVMANVPIIKISANENIVDNNTFILDLDEGFENVKQNLFDLLNRSKENDGPNAVCIQLPDSIEYSDVVLNLVEAVNEYITEKDNYYLLINFMTEDRYYLGYVNALIHSYYDGYDVTDFYGNDYLSSQPVERTKAS